MKNKITVILWLVVTLPMIGVIVYALWGNGQDERKIQREPVYTSGVIVSTYVGIKSRNMVKYQFKANGAFYYGDDRYYPKRELVKVGDTCEVVYAKSDPNIHKALRNNDKTFKIRKTISARKP